MSGVLMAERVAAAGAAHPAARRMADWMLFFLFAGQGVRNLAGWPGHLAVALTLTVFVALSLWRQRRDPRLLGLPPELLAFLLFSGCSLIWSNYQWATVLGLLAQWATAAAGIWLAIALSWDELLRALSSALIRILVVSVAFEVFVAAGVRDRLAPLGSAYGPEAPGAYFWSENLLLAGGPIQGIVGNRNLLAFLALLALVMLGARVRTGAQVRHATASVVLAVGVLLFTRSATVVAVGAAIAMLVGVVLALPRVPHPARRLMQAGLLTGMAVGLAGILSVLPTALGVLGRSDLTNRVGIWRQVLHLVEERPALGWGWVSYWAPWVQPYDDLVIIDGVEYLQAHNALLDVLLQLGVVGAAVAGVLAAAALVRGWCTAMGAPQGDGSSPGWWPFLILCALLGQALTESRLLIEGNWALLVALAVKLATDEWTRRGNPPFTRSAPTDVRIES
jgi:exopolysaccharide production protein ExoQ